MNSTLCKTVCNLNLKAQAVNKAQRQRTPELYFLELFKLRALCPNLMNLSLVSNPPKPVLIERRHKS